MVGLAVTWGAIDYLQLDEGSRLPQFFAWGAIDWLHLDMGMDHCSSLAGVEDLAEAMGCTRHLLVYLCMSDFIAIS